MAERNACSRRQFVDSGFDTIGYAFNKEPGIYIVAIDCKRWEKHKLLTYFTFNDDRKVVAPAWPNSNYLGLPALPVGTKVELEIQHTRTGKLNLKGVASLDAHIE